MVGDRVVKHQQRIYHDWEAASYERKFSISYDQRCIDYARQRFRQIVGDGRTFDRVLEIGTGTGFFVLNLALSGVLGDAELHACDVSAGMLTHCRDNARQLGVGISLAAGDAETLPYADESFDLVIGHAVLHHLPVPALALREACRVLKPGGYLVVAGEPTEVGSRLTGWCKRGAAVLASVANRVSARGFEGRHAGGDPEDAGAPNTADVSGDGDHDGQPRLVDRGDDAALAALEHVVDLHTFRPQDLARAAHLAGYTDVRVVTEELAASWFGWSARTIEALVPAAVRGQRWPWLTFGIYQRLAALDEALLRHVLPSSWGYNVILGARRPAVQCQGGR